MELGAFSISLTVTDLEASRAFYEKLGFEVAGGDAGSDYLILRNGETILGLFQGMFDKNILTFNPGLDNRMQRHYGFTDVREIQAALVARGLEPVRKAAGGDSGPTSIVLEDPDGNPILIDQFFDSTEAAPAAGEGSGGEEEGET